LILDPLRLVQDALHAGHGRPALAIGSRRMKDNAPANTFWDFAGAEEIANTRHND
jgi:hypothetical protein